MRDRKRILAVIMSVYKGDKVQYVKSAIESVLNQSYSAFDLYIQLDGPVMKDVDAYLSSLRDDRVVLFRRENNLGLAESLNELLAIVLSNNYSFIARMDADDYCCLDRFQRQLDYYDAHPDVDCLGSWAIEVDEDDREYYRKKMPELHLDCFNLFRKRDCMIHPTVMFRSSFFERAGRYATDTFFGEDTMMWAQGFSTGCVFANVPEFLYYFRIDEHFFERRRGWKYAKGIYELRHRVNRMLGFGIKEELYAIAYALAKLMPTGVLNYLYKTIR